MKKEQLVDIIRLVNEAELGSIKEIISSINIALKNPYTTAQDYVDIVECDPSLTTAILKIANSSYYLNKNYLTEKESVGGLTEAIIRIGFDEFYHILLHQKIGKFFNSGEKIYDYSSQALWEHCIAVALTAKKIFRSEFCEDGNSIYVAGLLHEIGIIVMGQVFHHKFKDILESSYEKSIDFLSAEELTQEFTHCEIGMALAESWNFPEEIALAIGCHHKGELNNNKTNRLLLTLYLADCICNKRKIGFCDLNAVDEVIFQDCLTKLDIEPDAIDLIIEEVEKDLLERCQKGLI